MQHWKKRCINNIDFNIESHEQSLLSVIGAEQDTLKAVAEKRIMSTTDNY